MTRTQLFLDDAVHAKLRALARKQGRTVSDLVREALDRVYGGTELRERLATLRAIEGLWKDRGDLGSTEGYVRRLRRDTRRSREETGLIGVLLDSDVIIDILRGRRSTIDAAAALERSGTPTFCCAISWAEIFAGLRPGEEPLTESFFQARSEVVIDSQTGRRAGAYLSRYARSHDVEVADALVAAAATTTGLRLWTGNRKHYPMPDVVFYAP